jgi:hypothetical protein
MVPWPPPTNTLLFATAGDEYVLVPVDWNLHIS